MFYLVPLITHRLLTLKHYVSHSELYTPRFFPHPGTIHPPSPLIFWPLFGWWPLGGSAVVPLGLKNVNNNTLKLEVIQISIRNFYDTTGYQCYPPPPTLNLTDREILPYWPILVRVGNNWRFRGGGGVVYLPRNPNTWLSPPSPNVTLSTPATPFLHEVQWYSMPVSGAMDPYFLWLTRLHPSSSSTPTIKKCDWIWQTSHILDYFWLDVCHPQPPNPRTCSELTLHGVRWVVHYPPPNPSAWVYGCIPMMGHHRPGYYY